MDLCSQFSNNNFLTRQIIPGDGVFLTLNSGIEMHRLSLGGEIKLFASGDFFWPVNSVSCYANYEHLSHSNLDNLHSLGVGFHLWFLGFESNYYFGNNSRVISLIPKIGLDFGGLSLFYGYGYNVFNESLTAPTNFHHISLKLGLNLLHIKQYFSAKPKPF